MSKKRMVSIAALCLVLTALAGDRPSAAELGAALQYQIVPAGLVEGTWENDTYYVSGNVTVDLGRKLTINAGTTEQTVVKFAKGASMTVHGTLDVNGLDADNRVVFTSKHDEDFGDDIDGSSGKPSRGDWSGIRLYMFYTSHQGTGQFDWSLVRYGGRSEGVDPVIQANLYFHYSKESHFTDSISELSDNYGVQIQGAAPGSPLRIRGSVIENNTRSGISISENGSPDLGTTGLEGEDPGLNQIRVNDVAGDSYELSNCGNPVEISALGNYWGCSGEDIDGHICDDEEGPISTGAVAWDPSWPGPYAVELVSFTAAVKGELIELEWITATEIDNAGFHLWRSHGAIGPYQRITGQIIPSEGGATWGAKYTYEDRIQLVPGHTHYYKLQDIDYNGAATFHGPVSVTVRSRGATGDRARSAARGS